MNQTSQIFAEAKELMAMGKQSESIVLLKKAASLGDLQAEQILNYLQYAKQLIKKVTINPLSIVDDIEINRQHMIPNIVKSFEQDILSNLGRLQSLNNGLIPPEIVELLIYQTIVNLIEYRNKALGILPLGVVHQVKEQIKNAFINVYIDRGHMNFIVEEYETGLMASIWEKDIEERAKLFMEKLDNKYFM